MVQEDVLAARTMVQPATSSVVGAAHLQHPVVIVAGPQHAALEDVPIARMTVQQATSSAAAVVPALRLALALQVRLVIGIAAAVLAAVAMRFNVRIQGAASLGVHQSACPTVQRRAASVTLLEQQFMQLLLPVILFGKVALDAANASCLQRLQEER